MSEKQGLLGTQAYKTWVKSRNWFRMNALMYRIALIATIVLCSAGGLAAKDWRGILPLHSTRADVEKLLGPPETNKPGLLSYSLEEGEIIIILAEERPDLNTNCASPLAAGTVLSIRVLPRNELWLKHLNLDESRFRKFKASNVPDSESEGFLNEEEGFALRANKGLVEEMVYLASAPDRPRCPRFYSDLESFVTIRTVMCGYMPKFDEYGDILFSDEKARLDNFAIQIQNASDTKAHVIVYAGQKAVAAEAQLRGDRIRNYLINVREIDPKRVTVVDGGYMHSLTVQLYVLPDGATLPEPDPTVKPEDVQIVFEKPKPRVRKKPNRSAKLSSP